ncbi:OmpA family protein [Hymenobacter tenuis]
MRQNKPVVEVAQEWLTDAYLTELGTHLNVSQELLKRTFNQFMHLVMRVLQERAVRANGPEAVATLARQARQAGAPDALRTQPPSTRRGVKLIQDLLGARYEQTVQRLHPELPGPTRDLVLETAVQIVLGVLGRQTETDQLTNDELVQWLQQEQQVVSANTILSPDAPSPVTLPEPDSQPNTSSNISEKDVLQRFTVSGAGTWEKVGGGITFTPGTAGPKVPAQLPISKWAVVIPLLIMLLCVGAYMRLVPDKSGAQHSAKADVAPVVQVTTPPPPANPAAEANAPYSGASSTTSGYDPATDTYIYNTGQPLALILPDGSSQKVGANSTEYKLFRLLNDGHLTPELSEGVSNPEWLTVDRVYFTPGEATLTPESEEQLQNLAGILKAFPLACIQIGGHTDNTSDPQQNQQLSKQQAEAALLALAGLGIERNRLQATGYGDQMMVAPNDGPVGRSMNRRLTLAVTSITGPPKPVARKVARTAAARTESRNQYSSKSDKTTREKKRPRTKTGKWIQRLVNRVKGER